MVYERRFGAICLALLLICEVSRAEVDWPQHGLDSREQRFSELDQINVSNVATLGLAWSLDTDYRRGMQATPIVIDGVMYVTGSWSVVYAIDARSGALLWKFDPQVPKAWGKMACCDVVNRGVAVSAGKVVVATLDARLIALDQATGAVVWETETADTSLWPYTITGAPRIAKGKVFIGNGGAEYGVRGFVSAFDLETGDLVWRFHTVPGNPADGFENDAMARAAQTWTGEWWKYGGGGTVWDSIVYDEEFNQLYIGVGNGSPWNRHIRSPDGGDNLYLSSIVALNPDSGEYIWHYQETPAETWDYTATQPMMLADMEWNGQLRKVLWQAPKNGFFFIIDRTNGELLSAEPYARVTWASGYDMATGRPIENPGADYASDDVFILPSSAGAHNWHPMAYSPETGYVYIPKIDASSWFKSNGKTNYEWGQWNNGVDMDVPGPENSLLNQKLLSRVLKGSLLAWDPVHQRVAWERPLARTNNGGVVATAGNLVFQGTADGYLLAFAADTGAELWRYRVAAGVVAPPVTYTVDGVQYVSVAVGWGGAFPIASGAVVERPVPPGRVLSFRLGADARLPPVAVESPALPPLPAMPPVSDETLAMGRKLYNNYCYMCHGHGMIANGAIPDLRRLPTSFYENFDAIVRDGAMSGAGMVGFSDVLSKDQTDAIYAYIIYKANELREDSQDNWVNSIMHFIYDVMADAAAWLDARQDALVPVATD